MCLFLFLCCCFFTVAGSDLYHDQAQTPGYPHGDGTCVAVVADPLTLFTEKTLPFTEKTLFTSLT